MLATMKKHGGLLTAYAIAITALVGLTHWLTHDTIIEQERQALQATLSQVIPENMHDNALFESCILLPIGSDNKQNMPAYLATLNDQPSAIAIETKALDGYNGTINLLIGLDMQGKVLATRVLSHAETPGLGDKIERRKSDWIDSFSGQSLTENNQSDWAVTKDGGQFDQFTGATITPRAVVNAVKQTLIYFQNNKDNILANPIACEE